MQTQDASAEVAVLGGGFAGAAAALLLKRRNPSWRVVILEKTDRFDRKVGESTTEVSSRFMTAVLGIGRHLGHEQLNKQGLRMWFATDASLDFERCAEIGARNNSRLSGFQVDRSVLDEHLLSLAVEAGCVLRRPAKVVELELGGEGKNRIGFDAGAGRETLHARWVIDASGRAALIARKLGLLTPLTEHPVNAIWARCKGGQDWDGRALRQRFPAYAKAVNTGRQWATNHLTGYGWWTWIIPLKGGDISVGLVYDSRLYTPPQPREGATLAERLRAHWMRDPVGREILADAEPIPGDVRAYSQLAYSVSRLAGDGWVLAGDAAGFLDPFYSPGLDFCSYTAHHAHTLVGDALEGRPFDLETSNRRFAICFRAWFESIYRDKYFYIGDAELMSAAFLIDIGSYHFGPVREVFRCEGRYSLFPFWGRAGAVAASVLSFLNRRLSTIARKKRAAGTFGDRNADRRLLIGGFLPDHTSVWLFLRGVGRWLVAEIRALPLAAAPEGRETALGAPPKPHGEVAAKTAGAVGAEREKEGV